MAATASLGRDLVGGAAFQLVVTCVSFMGIWFGCGCVYFPAFDFSCSVFAVFSVAIVVGSLSAWVVPRGGCFVRPQTHFALDVGCSSRAVLWFVRFCRSRLVLVMVIRVGFRRIARKVLSFHLFLGAILLVGRPRPIIRAVASESRRC